MSMTYSDLICNFPDSLDDKRTFQDVDINTKDLVDQYMGYVSNGDFESASDLIVNNPVLNDMLWNAYNMQMLYDMVIALERYYNNDVRDYILNIVAFRGTWDAVTKYNKYNVVNYTYDGTTLPYMCNSNDTPKGTLPTNQNYFMPLALKGNKGDDGIGLVFKKEWSSSTSYTSDDLVSYNNKLWVCINNNTNSTPSPSNSNWKIAIEIPTATTLTTIVSNYEKANTENQPIADNDSLGIALGKLEKTCEVLNSKVVSVYNSMPNVSDLNDGELFVVIED